MTGPINLARALQVLKSPDTPWTPSVIQGLAQGYIDAMQAKVVLEKELSKMIIKCADKEKQIDALREMLGVRS